MHLHDHFARNVPAALEAYAREAARLGWSIPRRLELYAAAKVAFDPDQDRPEEARRQAFARIYDDLRGVFRGARGRHFSPDAVRGALATTMAPYSRSARAVLLGLVPVEHGGLLAALRTLRPLKATRHYPAMAVSKFLHFFNPACFPIYDTAVVEDRVIPKFRGDYTHFRHAAGLDALGDDGLLVGFTAWARSLVVAGGPGLMPTFAAWFRAEVRGRPDPENVLADLTGYYATAFELVAIGAACLP